VQLSVGAIREEGVFHPQRLEDPLAGEPLQRESTDALHDVAEQEEVDVAVDDLLARFRHRDFVHGQRYRGVVSGPRLRQIHVGPQP
jgi:hypothetical protein